jgi:hypothetical protein
VPPTVTTLSMTDIGTTAATGNGNVTNLGYYNLSAYGICWNTTGDPTIADSKVDKGTKTTTGAFFL